MILTWQNEVVIKGAYTHQPGYTTVEEHFKQCFHDYFGKLFGYAFTIVKDNGEAKDIVQTAFLKLWEKRDSINFHAAARAYLYTTVYHLSLNTVRDRKVREGHHEQLTGPLQTAPLSNAEEKEIRHRIVQAIGALPPRCREVFCKSRLEGKKYAVIATEMDISVKTVEVQMGKALKALREQLADLSMLWMIYLFL